MCVAQYHKEACSAECFGHGSDLVTIILKIASGMKFPLS